MAIQEKLKKATHQFQEHVADKEALERLERFDSEMKKSGIIRPTTYGLPLPDTIQRDFQPFPSSAFDHPCTCELLNQF